MNTRFLFSTEKAKTTLAFVSLTQEGERDFVLPGPGGRYAIGPARNRKECFQGKGVFHFGSITMTHEPAYSATMRAISLAKKYGYLLSLILIFVPLCGEI